VSFSSSQTATWVSPNQILWYGRGVACQARHFSAALGLAIYRYFLVSRQALGSQKRCLAGGIAGRTSKVAAVVVTSAKLIFHQRQADHGTPAAIPPGG